jgi:Holliday junction resolvasome RuvABC endonuclease subunit
MLRLTETPPHDAADALAVGLTHLHSTGAGRPRLSDIKQV